MGSALGLAILSAMAITRTNDLLAAHTARLDALGAGYHRGLLVGSIFLIAAAVIALRIGNTRAAAPLVIASSATASRAFREMSPMTDKAAGACLWCPGATPAGR